MSLMIKEAEEAAQKIEALVTGQGPLYRQLGARLQELAPTVVGTLARGSSDHAVSYASYLIPQCTGRVVASLPPSLTTVLDTKFQLKGQLVLTVSQSGSSPDILSSMKAAQSSGALCIGISNENDSPLAKNCDVFLGMNAGKELGLAATKTVLCTQVSLAMLTAEWAEDHKLSLGLKELPASLSRAFQIGLKAPAGFLKGAQNVYVISRALGMTAAYEMALKIKETCGLHAEAFSSAEVRHGPKEIVNSNYRVIAIALPGSANEDVLKAAQELAAQGAQVLVIGPEIQSGKLAIPSVTLPAITLPAITLPTITLPTIDEARLYPILALQAFYPWISAEAVGLGRDPDRPRVLTQKVVHTI